MLIIFSEFQILFFVFMTILLKIIFKHEFNGLIVKNLNFKYNTFKIKSSQI